MRDSQKILIKQWRQKRQGGRSVAGSPRTTTECTVADDAADVKPRSARGRTGANWAILAVSLSMDSMGEDIEN
jgi:hypothetical protein